MVVEYVKLKKKKQETLKDLGQMHHDLQVSLGVVLRVMLRGQAGVGRPVLRLSISPKETLLW